MIKILIGIYRYSGLESICNKARVIEEQQPKRILPSLPLWLIGIYIVLFGLASQRYENRIDIIERKVTSIYTRLTPITNAIFIQTSTISGLEGLKEHSSVQEELEIEARKLEELQKIKKTILSKIPAIQRYPCPVMPYLFKPHKTILSLFVNTVHKETVDELKELIVDSREDLRRAKLQKASLVRANLRGADLEGADLEGADLDGANLRGANLVRANLRGANLEGANLERADLEGADLEGADLDVANLRGANLKEVNLEGANLGRANLGSANLWGARLSQADLWQASLRGANLEAADLWSSRLEKSYISETDLDVANLKVSNLDKARLEGAVLKGANLDKTRLEEANILGAINLTIKQLSKVKTLYGAQLDPELMEQVKEKYPHLLEKPKPDE